MTVGTAARPHEVVQTSEARDDERTHIACDANPDVALCGIDIRTAPWVDHGEVDCALCDFLDRLEFVMATSLRQ